MTRILAGTVFVLATAPLTGASIEDEARQFLALYNSLYVAMSRVSSEASWRAVTDVTPEHDGERVGANKAFSAFAGDRNIIERAREYLKRESELSPSSVRQLRKLLLLAA